MKKLLVAGGIVLILVVGLIAIPVPETEEPTVVADSPEVVEPVSEPLRESVSEPQQRSVWTVSNFTNDWGETTDQVGAATNMFAPLERMEFPYHDVRAGLMASCERVWIRFNDEPNLTGGEIGDGYEVFRLRVRVDGVDATWRVTKDWNARDVILPSSARAAWADAERFEVLMPYFDQKPARFQWELTGAGEALAKTCGNG